MYLTLICHFIYCCFFIHLFAAAFLHYVQVVKSHLKLTDEELFGTTEDANEELQNNENSESSAAVNSKQPWKKKAFTVDRLV